MALCRNHCQAIFLYGMKRRPAPKKNNAATLKGFAWGAASVAVLAGIFWFVMPSPKPKATRADAAAASTLPSDPLAQLQRLVEQKPDDLSLRDDLAKAYLARDNLSGVAEQTKFVLQRNPNDARALTYQALVHMAAHRTEVAAAMLKKATESDPKLLDGWIGTAWLAAQSGDLSAAQAAVDQAKRHHPEYAQRLDDLMAHLRSPQAAVPK